MTTELNKKLQSAIWRIESSIGDGCDVKKIRRKIKKIELMRNNIDSSIKKIEHKIEIHNERIMSKYVNSIESFKVTNKKCIINYLFLYKQIIREMELNDVIKSLLDELHERIICFRDDNCVIENQEEYVKDLKTRRSVKREYVRGYAYNRIYCEKYGHLINLENHKKAIEMGFKDLEEPLIILERIQESKSEYGYGKLTLSDGSREFVNYDFEGLMHIIEDPIFTNVFKLFNFKCSFKKERCYPVQRSEIVFREGDLGPYGSGEKREWTESAYASYV